MSAALREPQSELVARQGRFTGNVPAPASTSAAALVTMRNLGNTAVGKLNAQFASAPASDAEALLRLTKATKRIEIEIAAAKYRRDDQQKINDDQYIVSSVSETVGSVRNLFKGKGLHSVDIPSKTVFVESDRLLAEANARISSGQVIAAAHAVQDLADEYRAVLGELSEYLDSVMGGADLATTGLEAVAIAGAIAATVATGGAAAAAGSGLLGTSLAVGTGAGLYGLAQETATQGGEKYAGTRKEFDFEAIALRGGKDAVMGFIGTFAGGALAKYALGKFGAIVMRRLKPEQLEAVAQRFGVETSKLSPAVFLSKGQQFVVEFFSGVATTPLMAAVQVTMSKLEGQAPPSGEKFFDMVIEDAVKGGLLQLFLAAIMHGAPAPRRSGKSNVSGKSGRPGADSPEPIPVNEPVPPEAQTQSQVEGTPDLKAETAPAPEVEVAKPAAEVEPTAQPSEIKSEAGDTPSPSGESAASTTAEAAQIKAPTADPPLPVGPDGQPTGPDFADVQAHLDQLPSGRGPVKGKRLGAMSKSAPPPPAPAPRVPQTKAQRAAEAKLTRRMKAARRRGAIDAIEESSLPAKEKAQLIKKLKKSKVDVGRRGQKLIDLAADNPISDIPTSGKPKNTTSMEAMWKRFKAGKKSGEITSKTFEDYVKALMKLRRGGVGEMTRAFDVGPDRLMVKAPKPNSNARGSDMITYDPKTKAKALEDNKAVGRGKTVGKVSALEPNLLKNMRDDIAQLKKDVNGKNVPRALKNQVLPDMQKAARNLARYIKKNLNPKRPVQRRQLYSVKHGQKVADLLAKKGITRDVTTEGAGTGVGISSKLKAKQFRHINKKKQ